MIFLYEFSFFSVDCETFKLTVILFMGTLKKKQIPNAEPNVNAPLQEFKVFKNDVSVHLVFRLK